MSPVMNNRAPAPGCPPAPVVANGLTKTMDRDAEANRQRARTLAKLQQAAERVADQIASGTGDASSAARASSAAITQVGSAITRQLTPPAPGP